MQGGVGNAIHAAIAHLPYKGPGQRRNVIAAIAQWRQAEFKDGKAEIQILAEASLANFFFKVAVRGRHQPEVRAELGAAAHALEGALLQHPQQLDLHLLTEFANLIQEERALVGLLEASDSAVDGAGERLSLIHIFYRTAKRLFPNSEHSVFLLSSVDFFAYDHSLYRLAQEKMRAGVTWDVVHAVTPVSPSSATRLGGLGLPLVRGPLNGGLRTPSQFPELMKADSAWLYGCLLYTSSFSMATPSLIPIF